MKSVVFLRILLVHTMAAVDVDDVHGLGVFDDEVNTVFDGDHATEKALDLLGDIIIVKDGFFAFIKLHNLSLLWREGLDGVLDVFIEFLVVHVDVVERLVEQISQHDAGLVHLADHLAEGGHLLHLNGALLPLADE